MIILEGKFERALLVGKKKCFLFTGMTFCKGISFLFSDLDPWEDAILANLKWQPKHG